jgi:hypothetical protein
VEDDQSQDSATSSGRHIPASQVQATRDLLHDVGVVGQNVFPEAGGGETNLGVGQGKAGK